MKKTMTLLFLLAFVSACTLTTLAKDKEYEEGTLLDMQLAGKGGGAKEAIQNAATIAAGAGMLHHHYKVWTFTVKVGDTTYVAKYPYEAPHNFQYMPKEDDWPANSAIQVRFDRKSFLGMHTILMHIKRPDGKKEVEAWMISRVGPDGKETCGRQACS